MFEKFKEKRAEKKERSKERKNGKRKNNAVLTTLIASFVIGFLFAVGTDDFLLMIPVVLIPTCSIWLLTCLDKGKDYDGNEQRALVSFYENFLHFSSLGQSYAEGLEKAVELTPISHFREEVEKEKESGDFTSETFSCSNSWREERVFRYFCKVVKSGEEPDRFSLRKLSSLIDDLKNETEEKEKGADIPFYLILLTLFVLILVTCLLASI